MNDFHAALACVIAGHDLDADQAECAFGEILDGKTQDALVAAFLVALRVKRESGDELAGAARAMLARARSLDLGEGLTDVVGTGGDGSGSFNISTGAVLVAAAAGVRIAKHGNRAVSGTVGSADVLERLGVRVDLGPQGLRCCLEQAGICFIFAPDYHPVLKRLGGLRRELGLRTIFNLLGPLVNPARPQRLLVGVPESALIRPMAEALSALGVEQALVVNGEAGGSALGLDEISCAGKTRIAKVVSGLPIREFEVAPEDFGIERSRLPRAANCDESAATLCHALEGEPGPAHDVLALNAGAAIYVAGRAAPIAAGVAIAREVLRTGRALETLEKLRIASLE